MTKKVSILTLLAFACAVLAVAPAHADGIHEHGSSEDMDGSYSSDADRTPDHRRDTHIGENFILNVDRFSNSKRDGDTDSYSGHSLHSVTNTAEWIWWLNHLDKNKKDFDKNTDPVGAPVPAPEPASLLLLGSGVLALGVWRRRPNRSAQSC
jgi:PEP-CTERM motif